MEAIRLQHTIRHHRDTLATLIASSLLAALAAACGGGSSRAAPSTTSGPRHATTATPALTQAAVASATPAATISALDATPGTGAAPAPGDAAPPSTDAEGNLLPTVDIHPIDGPTPQPGIAGGSGTGSQLESTIAAGVNSDLTGGQPGDPQHIVGTPPPTLAPGRTPTVDGTNIAPADPGTTGLSAIVDADATSAGVQDTRTLHVGDIFHVAVVLAGIPPQTGQLGGVASLDFTVDYDRTKIVAPTLVGGSSTQRNPDLNTDALDGDSANWDCLPAPKGDLDDPGGIPGDGKPDTGQAFLSCFTSGHVAIAGGGDVTVAVITFQAVASGTTTLSFEQLDVGDGVGVAVATCPGTSTGCVSATINVEN